MERFHIFFFSGKMISEKMKYMNARKRERSFQSIGKRNGEKGGESKVSNYRKVWKEF